MILINGKRPTINDCLKIKDSKNSKNLLKKINQSSEEKRSYEPLTDNLFFIEKCLMLLIGESIGFNYNRVRTLFDNYQKMRKIYPNLSLEELVLRIEKVKAGGVKSKHCFKKKSKINFDTTKSKSLY